MVYSHGTQATCTIHCLSQILLCHVAVAVAVIESHPLFCEITCIEYQDNVYNRAEATVILTLLYWDGVLSAVNKIIWIALCVELL